MGGPWSGEEGLGGGEWSEGGKPTLSKTYLLALKEVRQSLTMEDCAFDTLSTGPHDAPLPKSETEVTDFIRERTRIWRQSWIFPILDQIIAEGEGKMAKPGERSVLDRIEGRIRSSASARSKNR